MRRRVIDQPDRRSVALRSPRSSEGFDRIPQHHRLLLEYVPEHRLVRLSLPLAHEYEQIKPLPRPLLFQVRAFHVVRQIVKP